ncbi:MAG TPA: response regulator [Thermoanaerobaculia bacterium]|nr:response regulator [Thermoanaerobaculia bacterium]
MDETAPAPFTALVIDDEVPDRKRITAALRNDGFSVDEAIDGRDALERLRRKQHYDVIVLDVLMPYVDGFEVIRFPPPEPPLPLREV